MQANSFGIRLGIIYLKQAKNKNNKKFTLLTKLCMLHWEHTKKLLEGLMFFPHNLNTISRVIMFKCTMFYHSQTCLSYNNNMINSFNDTVSRTSMNGMNNNCALFLLYEHFNICDSNKNQHNR